MLGGQRAEVTVEDVEGQDVGGYVRAMEVVVQDVSYVHLYPVVPAATVEMEEVRMQLVGIAERVLDVVKLVGRKRKSEEGTLWGEVERTKKRMDGFEELRTRMEGLEQETRERDDGMTEATHSLLAPPPLPSPPTQILGR